MNIKLDSVCTHVAFASQKGTHRCVPRSESGFDENSFTKFHGFSSSAAPLAQMNVKGKESTMLKCHPSQEKFYFEESLTSGFSLDNELHPLPALLPVPIPAASGGWTLIGRTKILIKDKRFQHSVSLTGGLEQAKLSWFTNYILDIIIVVQSVPLVKAIFDAVGDFLLDVSWP